TFGKGKEDFDESFYVDADMWVSSEDSGKSEPLKDNNEKKTGFIPDLLNWNGRKIGAITKSKERWEMHSSNVGQFGTGDHTFERRLRLGGPLLKENIATMVLESPFYGQRRPMLQRGAKLLCVSDLLLLGRATIEEARSLLHWMDSEAGFGKMGVCGLSMGGVHAAMVGSLHPTPVATFPFLSPHSAVVAFCEGILKHGTAWEALRGDLAAQKAAMTLEEVRERLRSVLSLTDVTRFPIPKIPNAVIFVSATDDGYIPKHSVLELQKAWPGSEVRWVTGGHVSSFLLHHGEFRRAIVDGLDRLPWKESPL
ncbi:Protein ABHD18, partial [Mucuna pruriens]